MKVITISNVSKKDQKRMHKYIDVSNKSYSYKRLKHFQQHSIITINIPDKLVDLIATYNNNRSAFFKTALSGFLDYMEIVSEFQWFPSRSELVRHALLWYIVHLRIDEREYNEFKSGFRETEDPNKLVINGKEVKVLRRLK